MTSSHSGLLFGPPSIFSLVLVFNHDVFIYIDIARIETSNAAADDVTN